MKRAVTVLLLFVFAQAQAQRGGRDRRDTLLFAGGVIPVPVFSGQTTPVQLTPVSQVICFNYQFYVKMHLGGRNSETCFMVNTEEGTVGMKEMVNSGAADCNLDINNKRFTLNVLSKQGNAFSYFNVARRDVMKHYVRTNFTHINPTPAPDFTKTVYKKTEKRTFCDGELEAWSYKAEGEKDILYLHGASYPEKLDGLQYLGAYGLGFVQTAQGNYLCLSVEHGDNEIKVLKIVKDRVCFNPQNFVVLEQEFGLEQNNAINRQRDRLEQKERDIQQSSRPCQAAQLRLTEFKKQQLDKEKNALDKTGEGNVYGNDRAKKAIAAATDPTDEVRKEIYQADVDLCFARNSLSNAGSGSNNSARLQERIGCLERKIVAYKKYEDDLVAIGVRYASKPGMAQLEKSKYYTSQVIMRSAQYKCK